MTQKDVRKQIDFTKWKTCKVAAQGDCLFDSIRIALESIQYKYTIGDLRHAVAKRILDTTDQEMSETIKTWIEIYKAVEENTKDSGGFSEDLMEWSQVSDTDAVASVTNSKVISNKDRLVIYNNMMTSSFWGEETTIRSLERALHARFLILHVNEKLEILPMQPTTNAKTFPYCVFILLILNGNHYQPMSHNGKFVFLRDTLPNDAKEIFREYI
jgi:hypothetical protein